MRGMLFGDGIRRICEICGGYGDCDRSSLLHFWIYLYLLLLLHAEMLAGSGGGRYVHPHRCNSYMMLNLYLCRYPRFHLRLLHYRQSQIHDDQTLTAGSVMAA